MLLQWSALDKKLFLAMETYKVWSFIFTTVYKRIVIIPQGAEGWCFYIGVTEILRSQSILFQWMTMFNNYLSLIFHRKWKIVKTFFLHMSQHHCCSHKHLVYGNHLQSPYPVILLEYKYGNFITTAHTTTWETYSSHSMYITSLSLFTHVTEMVLWHDCVKISVTKV